MNMNPLELLKDCIADALSKAEAYNLPDICTDLGVVPGEESEAFASKYQYTRRRVQALSKDEAVALGG